MIFFVESFSIDIAQVSNSVKRNYVNLDLGVNNNNNSKKVNSKANNSNNNNLPSISSNKNKKVNNASVNVNKGKFFIYNFIRYL